MSDLWAHLLYPHLYNIVTILVAATAIAHILTQVKRPSSMSAWILFIVVFPYPAVLLYILFSGRKLKRIIQRKGMIELTQMEPKRSEYSTIEALLCRERIPCATSENGFELCENGVVAYRRLMELIQNARHFIFITTYIFGKDRVTEAILEHLVTKAKEGVQVKILMDAIGSKWLDLNPSFLRPLQEAGGEYRFFMSVFRDPLNSKLNLRNHRKMIVVDGTHVLSGGMNIAEAYLSPANHPHLWADLSFVATGKAAYHYLEIFRSDWESQSDELLSFPVPEYAIHRPGNCRMQVVPSGPDIPTDALYEAILQAIALARRRIWIVTPYFIPDASLLEALTIARHRGVEVAIVVPDTSDHPLVDMSRIGFLRDLSKEGVSIHLYKSGMLHAKAILIDEAVGVLGSANFDLRSFFYNFEIAAFLYSATELAALEHWITALLGQCETGLKEAGRVRIIFENIFKIVAPAF